jgi:hypothetical protein
MKRQRSAAALRAAANKARVMESERLDRQLRVAWPKAMQGDLEAIEQVLHFTERQCEILRMILGKTRRGPGCGSQNRWPSSNFDGDRG